MESCSSIQAATADIGGMQFELLRAFQRRDARILLYVARPGPATTAPTFEFYYKLDGDSERIDLKGRLHRRSALTNKQVNALQSSCVHTNILTSGQVSPSHPGWAKFW